MKKTITTKKKEEEYWKCNRCRITSETKDRMCPCPRGGCEANVIGKIVTTTTKEIILTKKTK